MIRAFRIKNLLKFSVFVLLFLIIIPLIVAAIGKTVGLDTLASIDDFVAKAWFTMTIVKLVAFFVVSFYVMPWFMRNQVGKIEAEQQEATLYISEQPELARYIDGLDNKKRIIHQFSRKKWELFLVFLAFEMITAQLPFVLKHSEKLLGG